MSAPSSSRAGIRIGIDTGGTFTDVVAHDEATGRLLTTKTPSTPSDPSEAFAVGVAKALSALAADGGRARSELRPGGEEQSGRMTAPERGLGRDSPRTPPTSGGVGGDGGRARSSVSVAHGTTVATNALLEDRLGELGFVTTEGYRYVLEIARQSVPDGYGNSYFWVKPPRIVPVDRVREVGGRLDHSGREIRPFDEAGAVAVARWFRDRGIDTLGVCFLHAYANPDHERRMRDVLAREHPDAVVSISCEVLREYREYERSVTTLVDAAVKPRVGRYLGAIAGRLEQLAGAGAADEGTPGAAPVQPAPFVVMKSNGGVASADEVAGVPITTVLSGPAAGSLGAATIARAAGYDRLLTLDGGGTSTDVSVVLAGEPTLTTEGTVGRYPSKIPMIDVVTVGAGGGSVAWISPEGTLKVGPRSAGADPGPICYGRGGDEPTVTDAHLALGRVPPHLLGGEIPLDADAAREGLARLADGLGLDVEQVASGILEISAWNQANAIRRVTVTRGIDVRTFTLAAFGGSGPLLVCRLLDVLGLPAVVVPRDPGNLSAYGLLTVDVRNDYVQTHVVRDDALDLDEIGAVYATLESQASAALEREGFAPDERRSQRSADLRYFGQAFEVRVPAPAGPLDSAAARQVVAAFHAEHERLYGYDYRDDPRHGVEWVNLRVTGVGPIRRPALPRLAEGDGDPSRAMAGTRPVHLPDAGDGGAGGWLETPIYDRAKLEAGDVVDGPAVIQEFGSTLPVHPGCRARVDGLANIVLTRQER